jgi:cytochrome c peroxidase
MDGHKLRWISTLLLASLLLAALAVWIFQKNTASQALSAEVPVTPSISPSANYFSPLPQQTNAKSLRALLGEKLFHEPRLSGDNSISCASCHNLQHGGVDGLTFSQGVAGALGDINAPTVFNSSLSFVQFWNGRAATLEEQAAGPIHNPLEMASNWDQALAKLRADETYRKEFSAAYKDGITPGNVVHAIASFERTLITPDSPFDRHLRGEAGLTTEAVQGYQKFLDLGCASCHQGVLIGGNMYQKFGVLRDYFQGRELSKADLGRYNVTGREEDRHVFKVPSLRNVALTAPYFHDGSAKKLEDAVKVMGRYQLGRELSEPDIALIVAFLHSLTGEWEGKPLQ